MGKRALAECRWVACLPASMSLDVQRIVSLLDGFEDDEAVYILNSILRERPELAPPVVSFAIPYLTYTPARALTELRATGKVRNYNHKQGFGFIECPELYEAFGCDAYLHKCQVGDFQPEDVVNFAVMLNPQNKPAAYDLSPGNDACLLKTGGKPSTASHGGPYPRSKRRRKDNDQEKLETLGYCHGTIKWFSKWNRYGFIESPELKQRGYKDVFLLQDEKRSFAIGSEVMFRCFLNEKGLPQAEDLVCASDL